MINNTFPIFWMVWNPRKRSPEVRHLSYLEAVQEAERILNSEQAPAEIYVLQAVHRKLSILKTDFVSENAHA